MKLLPLLALAASPAAEVDLPEVIEDIKPLLPMLVDQAHKPWVKALLWLLGLAGMILLGMLVTKVVLYVTKKLLLRSRVDHTAIPFLHAVVKAFCYIVLFLVVVGNTGLLDPASLVAILGVVGLAISLAIQDSLANLAGGALLLLNKPFTREDFVDIGDISGTIVEVRLTYTILRTVDNKRISIPNGQVTKERIVNYSSEPYRRMEVLLTLDRDCDMDRAEQVLLEVLQNHPMVLKAPPCSAKVSQHSDLGTVFSCRAWATREDYWTLWFQLHKLLKQALDQNGLSMPVRVVALPGPEG